MSDITKERIENDLAEINTIIKYAKTQRKVLLEMRNGKPEEISMVKEVLKAIDEYVDDKPIAYCKTDESTESHITLKIINTKTNSTARITLMDMDWL